jgi:hypothetical protein
MDNETPETNEELDDLDPQLFESDKEEATPEEEATIEIKGQPVKLSDVEKIWDNYQNDSKWQSTNTQKAQEIAAEKQDSNKINNTSSNFAGMLSYF